jgi:tRNA (guanine37-N1)-methyltransferase
VRIRIVTLFPEVFAAPASTGIVGRAIEMGRVDFGCVNPRDFTSDRHRTVDDTPYGGGAGMVLKAPPFVEAVECVVGAGNPRAVPVVLMSPQGERFTQALAHAMSGWSEFVLVCGRYKAIDERFRALVVTHEMSTGDYVLSGGEPAANVILDAVVRLLPGALGDEDSAETDSFGTDGKGPLDCGYYTRPPEYRGLVVPEILISGHHARIEVWRRHDAEERTRARRPDLAAKSAAHRVAPPRETGAEPARAPRRRSE